MIKATVIALLLVLQDSQATTSWGSKSKSKHEFIKKMRLSQKMHGKIPRKLSHDNLLAKSVHKPGLRANPSEPASKTTGTTKDPSAVTETSTQETDNRHLYASSFWPWKTSNNNNASDYDAATDEIEDGMNETDVTDNSRTSWWTWNGWGNNKSGNATDENDMWESENQTSSILETLADFSIKYAGCMALTSIADQDEEGSNFVNQNFVTYRLCPADSCEDDSWTGCKTTYGEYLMSLEDFLTVQQDYVDEEFKYYCDYCEKCVYYQTWFTNYTADGEISNTTGCAHYTECLNAADECSEEAQEEREEEGGYMLENFLECQEIEFDYYASDQDESDFNETASGYYFEDWSNTEYELNGKAYIGSHCNAGVIEIGLFADESCINYVGNQINFANVSVYEEQAQAIQEMYVPEGCLRCDGDNIKLSDFWFPEDEEAIEQYQQEQYNEEVYVSEICYNMYTESAKCHSHFTEDDTMALELTESELLNSNATCDFIEEVAKGHVDELGLVYSRQASVSSWASVSANAYYEASPVTAVQAAALTVTSLATAAMACMAVSLKLKVNRATMTESLMTNEEAGVST